MYAYAERIVFGGNVCRGGWVFNSKEPQIIVISTAHKFSIVAITVVIAVAFIIIIVIIITYL